ncbi:sugar transporter [Afipia sp. P52-10]|jgi:polysaccharide export outer membrane protein|nr:polysaccharide biosynthesis/export family protein [Afipia sp. P52-10]ETR77567.1 sugar transporter [Afipia sp. P52-10]
MQRRGPVAAVPQPKAASSLDAMAYSPAAYGRTPPVTGPRVAAAAGPVAASPPPVVMAQAVAPTRPGLLNSLGIDRRSRRAAPMPAVMPAAIPLHDPAYHLDAGDRLRIVVYGQEGLSNSYSVDAAGAITMPLIGTVPARGATPAQLARAITSRLQNGFIREPYVAVEIEAYRPFFILGEVAAPGQYPYVPNMTAESAVAIAGGFTPRAKRGTVEITRTDPMMGPGRIVAPPNMPLQPGDTIVVGERWF